MGQERKKSAESRVEAESVDGGRSSAGRFVPTNGGPVLPRLEEIAKQASINFIS